MHKLNLLPWRKRRRKRSVNALLIDFGFTAFLGIIVTFLWAIVASSGLSEQQARNAYILQQNHVFVRTSSQITVLQKQKNQLLRQIQLLNKLEDSRQVTLDVWSGLSSALSESVYLTSISKAGEKLIIRGRAEKKRSISELIRALERTPVFKNPTLSAINLVSKLGKNVENTFKITVEINGKGVGAI